MFWFLENHVIQHMHTHTHTWSVTNTHTHTHTHTHRDTDTHEGYSQNYKFATKRVFECISA